MNNILYYKNNNVQGEGRNANTLIQKQKQTNKRMRSNNRPIPPTQLS